MKVCCLPTLKECVLSTLRVSGLYTLKMCDLFITRVCGMSATRMCSLSTLRVSGLHTLMMNDLKISENLTEVREKSTGKLTKVRKMSGNSQEKTWLGKAVYCIKRCDKPVAVAAVGS